MKYRVITATLKARTALHVGSGAGNALADDLLRRDAQGGWLIPGTAIAGHLRSALTRLAPRLGVDPCIDLWPSDWRGKRKVTGCGCAVCRLMGDVDPSDEEKLNKGIKTMASRLLVFNATWTAGAEPLIRDGVGLDRATGAAARQAQAKFDLEVLPAGTQFILRMELREPPGTPEDEIAKDTQLLAAVLAEWQGGRLWLGGDTGRGLGAFDVCDLRYWERDLDDSAGLLAHLRASTPWNSGVEDTTLRDATASFWSLVGHNKIVGVDEAQERAEEVAKGRARNLTLAPEDSRYKLPLATGWAAWELTLQAEGPLLTNDATSAGLSGFDHAPLLATLGDWTQPVLAGSGLRGVLRAQAERIARTLATQRALQEQGREQQVAYFLEHCPACDPLMQRPRKDQTTALPLESCDSLLRYAVNEDENKESRAEDLCLACQVFGNTRRGSRLRVEDAPFVGGTPSYKMLDFLAVDRFTGGGAEHLKFDALALWKPAFTLRLWLDDPEDWELGWLTLALRDLAEGWLRVGYGAAKGFGQVRIAEGVVRVARLNAGKLPADAQSVYAIREFALTDPALRESQRGWVKALQDKLVATQSYRQHAQMALGADSYFKVVDRLYPVMEGGA